MSLGKTFTLFSFSFPTDLMAGLDIFSIGLLSAMTLCPHSLTLPALSENCSRLTAGGWILQTSRSLGLWSTKTLLERLKAEVLKRRVGGSLVWVGLGGRRGGGEDGPEGLDWLARWACQMLRPSCEISHPPAPYPPSSSSGWLSTCIICPI